LTQLVARGAVGDAEIDAELARDATATGEKRAATARSARPTTAAKADAWSAVMDSDALSNHLQSATMGGFWVADQQELTRPYVSRFFEVIADIWRSRSFESAQTITQMMYPHSVVDQATVDLTDAYLRDGDPQPALRRLLGEGRDGVARALRARERDLAA
jgi:aminopeptidase N